ncbi:Ig-like domain-containing protein [Sorangium sp. So ce1389]|uniref:Ig-like domain-containing protein n=1 Tax=Sorangium sp. So ce1389 TaxID=3133336 RepID=UPI003F607A02
MVHRRSSKAFLVMIAGAFVSPGCGAVDSPRETDGETDQQAQALGSFSFQHTLDMNGLLAAGQVTSTVNTEFDIGQLSSIFDGDTSSLARTPAVNPCIITLASDAPVNFNQSRIMLATDGTLKLEIADSLSDLDSHTGTYTLAINNQVLSPNTWGSASFTAAGKFVRATVTRTVTDDYVHINEWELGAVTTINSIKVTPSASTTANSVKMLTGRSLQLKARYADTNKRLYPITHPQTWSSSNPAVATVDSTGKVTATGTAGTATLTVAANGVSDTVAVTTSSSLTQTRDASRTRKVAVVLRDPPVPQHGNVPMHQLYGWNDPNAQIATVISRLRASSGGAVNYVVVQTTNIGTSNLYTRWYGAPLNFNDLISWYDQGFGFWNPQLNAAADSGNLGFEYNQLLTDLQLCEKRDAGLIDEVWVYTDPYGGMFESRLAGPGAFWYNSDPLLGTTCNGQLPIMGLNYEASTPNAVHSFGHRMESVMTQVMGRWNAAATDPNDWEKFATLDKDKPGQGHVGNTHIPVNGLVDYDDYDILTPVTSYEANWQYYPFLQDITTSVSCTAWGCTDDGYYQFMFGHIPRFTSVSDGKLNNWWFYFLDYPAAVKAARDLTSGNVGHATLGFENTASWTASVGTKTQDTVAGERTQGAASLKLTGIGAGVTLTSAALSSSAVAVAEHLSVDVRVSTQLAGLTGAELKLCLKSPQRGIGSYVCSSQQSLNGIANSVASTFYTVPWTLPSATLTALKAGSFNDLQIQVVLSGVPSGGQSASWVFDRAVFF